MTVVRGRRRFARTRGLGLLLALAMGGCQGMPGAPSAGRRLLADLFVIATSPVQVPAMAWRDSLEGDLHPGLQAVVLPFEWTGRVCWHTALTGLHALDVVATPLHLFDEDEAPAIYTPYRWPMPPADPADIAGEAGNILLLSAGTVGGVVIGHWFAVDYLPRALGY